MTRGTEKLIRAALRDGCREHCDALIDELRRLAKVEAALAEPTVEESLQVESAFAENATTQQQLEEAPPSDYRRGYWDGFEIGKREGRIEAENALAEPVQEPAGQLQEDAFGRGQVMWLNKPADLSMLYTYPPQRPAEPVQDDLIPPDSLFVCGQMGAHVTRVRLAEPVQEPVADRAASIRWQLCLLAQTEEFSDEVRNQIGRGVWLIDRLTEAAQAEPVLQTCNCRWDGETQVQQCTLHEAHVDAIHEWAERAKTAEKKLAAVKEPVQEQAKSDHETRAEIAEQQVVQLAEERDHYLNLWLKAKQAEPAQEPVQEPVAWRTFDGEGGYDYRTYEDNEDYAAEWAKRNPRHVGWVEPLYTAPPRRKPVEWDGRCVLGHCNSPAGCENSGECRAVERAHGIE